VPNLSLNEATLLLDSLDQRPKNFKKSKFVENYFAFLSDWFLVSYRRVGTKKYQKPKRSYQRNLRYSNIHSTKPKKNMNPFSFFLISNSFLILGLILNQNDVTKDSTKNLSSNISPFEKITWFSLSLQFFLLLIQTKMTEF
jgi:hypothetical protein